MEKKKITSIFLITIVLFGLITLTGCIGPFAEEEPDGEETENGIPDEEDEIEYYYYEDHKILSLREGAETAQTAFTVGECNLNEAETPSNASARIVNTGGVNIGSDRMVTVYSEGEHRGNISFDLGLEAGEEAYVDLVSTDEDHFTSGTQYTVVDGDFPDITFHCN